VAKTPTNATNYTFDPFARHQFYIDINAALVRLAIGRLDMSQPRARRMRVVELASGTGAVTEQILDELERRGYPAAVIAVEPSPEALAIARDRLHGRDVEFVQGDADQLAEVVSQADAAFFCNAIHLVRDKADALAKIAHVLAPGGILACNSTFFNGAYAPGSERSYHLYMRKALSWLRRHHPEARLSHRERAATMQWLTADEYVALAEDQGLRVVDRDLAVGHLSLQAWQDIGHYSLFIEGALPGVPLPIGAAALEQAAADTFAELDLTFVPRIWLQLVMRRVVVDGAVSAVAGQQDTWIV
jgi:ubiquinone/menaquinone biosynthesis C-methylase UbiE